MPDMQADNECLTILTLNKSNEPTAKHKRIYFYIYHILTRCFSFIFIRFSCFGQTVIKYLM